MVSRRPSSSEDQLLKFVMLSQEEKQMKNNIRTRSLEDVDYWRKRAGWFDDDQAMKDYNTGVHSTYYSADDDMTPSNGKSGLGPALFGSLSSGLLVKISLGIAGVVFLFMIIRAMSIRSSTRQRTSSKKTSSRSMSRSRRSESRSRRSSSRSRSKSKPRSSRSKSRTRRREGSDGDYELMSDDGEKSRRSRSTRSRSKSKTRRSSRSKSRTRPNREEMLV